jgi:dipeptidyl-peptidase-4
MIKSVFVISLLLFGIMMEETVLGGDVPGTRRSVTAADVAKRSHPGSGGPASFVFVAGGRELSYLAPEGDSLTRSLWRIETTGNAPARVVARPPGGGDDDANVSREEALRRERSRTRAVGITHVVYAVNKDIAIMPIRGDLYLQREGAGELERITKTAEPEIDPQLSADGSKVAFVRGGELYTIDLSTRKETKLTEGATEGVTHGLAEFIAQEEMSRSTGFWWAPDGSKIAYQETDERHIPSYVIAHQGGKEFSTETHRYPFSGAANAKVRLFVTAMNGGSSKELKIADGDDFYLARAMWRDSKTLLVQILSRDQKSLRLERIDVESGDRKTLVEERSDTWVNLHDCLAIAGEKGEFVWSSERTGFRHLELRDSEGAMIRVLTSGDWGVDGLILLDIKRREVWFEAGRESPLEAKAYRVSLDGGPIHVVTREPGTHRVVASANGDYYVDMYSSRSRPPVTTLRDRSGKLIATLHDATSDARIREFGLEPPEITEFKTRDGVTLYGAYYAPRGVTPGRKAPLIVMVYGGPTVQTVTDSWGMTADLTARFYNDRGFAVWKADNRGSSRRGVAFSAAIYRNMGDIEVRDQVDGVKFVAASRSEVDSTRVGITGASYGGYMTLRALTEAPEVFRAGVSIAPVTDWDGYDTCYTERYMGTPKDNAKGYKAASVIERADRIKGELLLIHGMIDENVHFRHSARLVNALMRASRPFQMLAAPDSRHGARREEDRKYIAERSAAFFESTLGTAISR